MNDVSIITAHFKDFLWIELLVEKIKLNTDMSKVREIIIINQDRCESSGNRLRGLDKLVRVVEYPVSEKHFRIQGHDHAAVLNAAVLEATGTFICIFDSDAHPIKDDWVDKCSEILRSYDAILARSPYETGTHPCFMVFKREHTQIPLAFDERLFDDGVDTGRLIGEQLSKAGQKVFYSEPSKCFSGRWGTTYLDAVYHHGNGSFHTGGPLLTVQVTWAHRFFRKRVLNDRKYEFTSFGGLHYKLVAAFFRYKDEYIRPMKTRLCKVRDKVRDFFQKS